MKLYTNPLSTYSQKAMIAFHEKDVAFQPEIVWLMDPAARAAYEAVYPVGRVPMLDVDCEHKVPESTTIIEFLEDRYPSRGTTLIPQNDREAARKVRFWDRMADQYLNDPVVTLLFMTMGFRAQDDEAAAKARKWIAASYAAMDKYLATGPWILGEFSMADCALLPGLYYARQVAPFDSHPLIADYWSRANQRPSVAAVFKQADEGMATLQVMMAGKT